MDQELTNGNKLYDIATYNRRKFCVTIKKYNVNKPPYIQIRLFTAKENEEMTLKAYVLYTLNNFNELSQIFCYLVFALNSMIWNFGLSRISIFKTSH